MCRGAGFRDVELGRVASWEVDRIGEGVWGVIVGRFVGLGVGDRFLDGGGGVWFCRR